MENNDNDNSYFRRWGYTVFTFYIGVDFMWLIMFWYIILQELFILIAYVSVKFSNLEYLKIY